MGVNKITFHEGERRELTATVTSKNPKETVVIASAEFELRKVYDDSLVQSGSCDVVGNEATVFLDLNLKGNFVLKTTSYVGREVIIKKILVDVE